MDNSETAKLKGQTTVSSTEPIGGAEINQLKKDVQTVKEDLKKAKREIEEGRDETKKTNNFMYVVVIFVSATFIVTVLSLFWSQILTSGPDKELYLKYNEVYKNYSDQISNIKEKVNSIKTDLDLLKARNPGLL